MSKSVQSTKDDGTKENIISSMNHELYSWLTTIPENVTQGVDVVPITALQTTPVTPDTPILEPIT